MNITPIMRDALQGARTRALMLHGANYSTAVAPWIERVSQLAPDDPVPLTTILREQPDYAELLQSSVISDSQTIIELSARLENLRQRMDLAAAALLETEGRCS